MLTCRAVDVPTRRPRGSSPTKKAARTWWAIRAAHMFFTANPKDSTLTNQPQGARVYSHNGPIRRGKRGHILTTDQSDTGNPKVGLDTDIWPP
eukprot:2129381-Pyramimonas_sp.AAC.1